MISALLIIIWHSYQGILVANYFYIYFDSPENISENFVESYTIVKILNFKTLESPIENGKVGRLCQSLQNEPDKIHFYILFFSILFPDFSCVRGIDFAFILQSFY